VPFAHEEPVADEVALAGLESRLSCAVEQRRIADVPLGAFLSGGVDSSLIVALMQEQSVTPVQTFTVRFEQAEYNEADHAAAVARHLGTDHYEETCGTQQLLDVIDALPDMFDEPFADSSAVPTFLVSRIARSRVTVALSGDGGDELFLGYPRHRLLQSARWALALPGPVRRSAATVAGHLPTRRLRRIADVLRSDDADPYGRFVSWFSDDEIAGLTGARAGESVFYADARARTSLSDPSYPGLLDLVSYLPDDILTKVDRTSMAVSLEVRAPLLDHRVVEFALGLPIEMKLRGGVSKWLLRQLLYRRVPRELVDRPKMGFGVPLAEWFRGPLRARMTEYCRGSELEDLGLDPRRVRKLWDGFLAGQPCRADLLWQIFMLAAWARRFRTRPVLATAH
jgi:asparagine synthase (glutamine-hydrolysing)